MLIGEAVIGRWARTSPQAAAGQGGFAAELANSIQRINRLQQSANAKVTAFQAGHYDFCGLAGEFPDGLDCTVFAFDAIARAHCDRCAYNSANWK